MKLQPDRIEGVNVVTGLTAGAVHVNGRAHASSLLLPWRGAIRDWACSDFAAITAAHFEPLLALQPELVIFGSGSRLRFVAPAALRHLIESGIGIETMDTAAACRTYNVLAAEGREVVAALLLDNGALDRPPMPARRPI